MARLIFAAHDPGGALIIEAVADSVRNAGHEIQFIGSGPAVKIWRASNHNVLEISSDGNLDSISCGSNDAIITGTGLGHFEQNCWLWAKSKRCPAMAVIDAWTSFSRRFQTPTGLFFPDFIGVIDEAMALMLAEELGTTAQIMEIGQPHLRNQTQELADKRAQYGANAKIPTVVFFSEPIIEDFGPRARGFDQFGIFKELISGLDTERSLNLILKPHPRETSQRWNDVILEECFPEEISVHQSKLPTKTLLVQADSVIGITTSVLLEAFLLGIPILSIQVGRTGIVNPVIDEITEPILCSSELKRRLKLLLQKKQQVQKVNPRFQKLLQSNDSRFIDAVERLVAK